MELVKKSRVWLLGIILVSYFVVGFPDGAFTVSWLGIADEIRGMTTAHTGYILVGYSVTYTLAGVILSRLNRFMKLQTLYLWGLVIMGVGFVGLALSPNFALVLATITVYGFGTGLMASSMNSYMAKHFTARHNNWMHCFWGAGASLSPIIMGQMMAVLSWRAGYFAITGILLIIAVMLLLSMYKKVWIDDSHEAAVQEDADTVTHSHTQKRVLTKKWHQAVEILTFFFLGGTDYTLVFFTGAALIARGHQTDYTVAIFSAVYYVAMTVGRMFFGWVAKWIKEVPIVRIGVVISIAGVAVLYFTSNVAGIALTGFGLAPMLPTLVSDTSNRFSPRVLSKIVGYELAAFGAGIAVLFFITSQILHFISYEALFPLALGFIVLVFVCNEILVVALRNSR
ncbi:MAG: MFS transporter [Defluviitaleaceae bacterium]|nr:MFS transporter [Defluviitaleaceae bacterium]